MPPFDHPGRDGRDAVAEPPQEREGRTYEEGTVMALMAGSGPPQEHREDMDHIKAFRELVEEADKTAAHLDALRKRGVIGQDFHNLLLEQINETLKTKLSG